MCIQFEDKAVAASDLMRDLYLEGMKDMRLLRIWQDLLNEVRERSGFPSRINMAGLICAVQFSSKF